MKMKTGADYRFENKNRQKTYRAEMKEKGYTPTAIFMNTQSKDILKVIGGEQALPQYAALEWVLNQYHDKSLHYNKSLHCNSTLSTGDIEQKQAVQEITVNPGVKISELEFEPDIKTPLSGDLPAEPEQEPQTQQKPLELEQEPQPQEQENRPAPGTPEYHTWLYNEIARLKATGLSFGKIEKKFNSEGTLSFTGQVFTRNMANNFYKKETKRRA